jgi:ABC-type antimicrobial peptide transport system permease subunit
MVCIPMGGGRETYYEVLKNDLSKDPRILSVSGTGLEFPFFNWRQGGVTWEGRDQGESIQVSYNVVDYHFISTMEMEMIEGEDFTPGKSYQNAYIINQELADKMGRGSVMGKTLRQPGKVGRIVGVVKNFHFNSFQNTIEPLILELMPKSVDNLLIRISGSNTGAALSFIKETWKRIIPQYPFKYSFLEDDYQANLVGLNQTGFLVSIFSLLAILISCLGLFGLSSYSAVQKTREIGLRKVMGASVFSIIRYISREFIYLVLLANIIVWPVAFYLLNQWLSRFAYHTDLGWGTFAVAAVLSLGISLLTIAYQTIKAARTNPIDTLRYE